MSSAERSTQTERGIEYVEHGTECAKPPSRATQTTAAGGGADAAEAARVRIDPRVVDMLLEGLAACKSEEPFFRALDEFHRKDAVELVHFRTVEVPPAEQSTVVDIVGGAGVRVAILFGEPRHDSWCLHADTGRILIYQRLRFASVSIRLPNCPSAALFGAHNLLIIGSASGELFLCADGGEILWHSTEIHTRALTALRWLRRDILLSCGLDGRVALSTLHASFFEPLRHVDITLGDLPRAMRPPNAANLTRPVGVVDADVGDSADIFLLGETGALWLLDARNMSSHSLGRESDGVERFRFVAQAQREAGLNDPPNRHNKENSDLLVLLTIAGSLKLKSRNLPSTRLMLSEKDQRAIAFAIKSAANLLVCAFDDGEIVGLELTSRRIVLRQTIPDGIIAMTLCDGDSTLAVLGADLKLHLYNFSIDF